jgi:hypothetical protein
LTRWTLVLSWADPEGKNLSTWSNLFWSGELYQEGGGIPLMYVFSVRNFILMFYKHFIVWFLSLFKSFFLDALTYIGLSFPLQEKLHMHKMEYTYSWQSSNVLDKVPEKLYFGQWQYTTKMYRVNAIWLLKKNQCRIKKSLPIYSSPFPLVTVWPYSTDVLLKTFRTTLVSAIFRQFGSCFGLFDIAG